MLAFYATTVLFPIMTADQLRTIRESRRLTRKEFADELGDCSESTVNKWERGVNPVPAWVEDKILRKVRFDVNLEDLQVLMEHGRTQGRGLDSILAEAVHEYAEKHRAEERAHLMVLAGALTEQPATYNAGAEARKIRTRGRRVMREAGV